MSPESEGKKEGAAGATVDGMPFEQALERLESIVAKLETGQLSLDESLALFQEGIGLARVCTFKLEEAEAKIEQLVEESGGKIALKTFRQEPKS